MVFKKEAALGSFFFAIMEIEQKNEENIMNILITNDDGIHAQGIIALANAVAKKGHNVTVVAPDREKSACSHSFTIDVPLTAKETAGYPCACAYAVSGTPADCVKIGMMQLIKDKIDLVLSGINMGANVGADIAYSGTVGAALEANMMGIPAIAFSQALEKRSETDHTEQLAAAAELAAQFVERLDFQEQTDFIYNINFPDTKKDMIKGIKCCPQGVNAYETAYEKRVDPFGRNYYWLCGQRIEHEHNEAFKTDVKWVGEGYITITPLKWNQTDEKTMESIKCKMEDVKLHF